MRRLALGFALLLCSLNIAPARAGGVLVLVDSLYVDNAHNYAPFFDLLGRSLKPGKRVDIVRQDGSAAAATYTLSELVDSVSPTGTAPRFDYDLIVVLEFTDNDYLLNTARRYPVQLSKAVNRPKVPVLYLSASADLHQGSGDDSLGVRYASDVNPSIGTTMLATSPAGVPFPVSTLYSVKLSTGAGLYVTPVLWLACYNYTKADPDGVGGSFSSGAVSDTLAAWFYNPPIASTRVGLANAAGYGVVNWEPAANNAGTANYPASQLGVVAVGMAAKLAPTIFSFPAQHVALDVDDGCKRFSSASSYPQVADALAGLDSLGVWKIPYTLGIEVDSMTTIDTNGSTRFVNEWTALRRYGMGKVTVHCHRGFSSAQGGSSAGVADTSLATASGGAYTDIFGSGCNRYPFGSTTGTTRDQSVYSLLLGATNKLKAAAGGGWTYVTRHVMPPTDDYSTRLAGVNGFGAVFDSISYAIALAGYRVVRTQYLADQYHFGTGSTGGIGRVVDYYLPGINSTVGANLTPAVSVSYNHLLYVPSRYLWGTTTDTTSTADYGNMRASMSDLLGSAVGFNRPINMTTAQQSASANLASYKGVAKGVIWVTHLPNWRQGLAGSATVYGGGRPAWEVTRQINGVMEAAKWCAQQANTSSTTYFRDGPIKWVYSDQITEKDCR